MSGYVATTLASDQATGSAHVNASLVNPWGLAYGPTTNFWLADEATGTSIVLDGTGAATPATPLIVTVPPAAGGLTGTPTGMSYNGSAGFSGDTFIFDTLDGTLSGWSTGTGAVLRVDNSASGAAYTGLALATSGANTYLYAANFAAGTVDVFDGSYAPVNLGAAAFVDSTLPSGYSPYNVQAVGAKLYVTYAQHASGSHTATVGAGLGYVSVFNPDGTFVSRFASGGDLNAPWGVALAPAGYGTYAGALLVGNFGDGRITAFNAVSGSVLGQLSDANGAVLAFDGLWALSFGNGASAGSATTLYYTAGPVGGAHGRFGSVAYGSSGSSGGGGGGY